MARIRTARVGDAGTIAYVHVLGWRHAYDGLLSQATIQAQSISDREAFWTELLCQKDRWPVFMIESSGAVVGFASPIAARDADLDSNEVAELAAIYLLEESVGKGLGSMLIERCFEEAQLRGHKTMIVWTLAKNEKALQFYKRHGLGIDSGTQCKHDTGSDEVRLRIDFPIAIDA